MMSQSVTQSVVDGEDKTSFKNIDLSPKCITRFHLFTFHNTPQSDRLVID